MKDDKIQIYFKPDYGLRYYVQIGREQTPLCHHCATGRYGAAHLGGVPSLDRATPWPHLGFPGAISHLAAVAQLIVESESIWDGLASFCEDGMSKKEVAEREKSTASSLPSRRGTVHGTPEKVAKRSTTSISDCLQAIAAAVQRCPSSEQTGST